jgi:S-DNA-T family DNA segregation ATPase FtsK/SpoIIIE
MKLSPNTRQPKLRGALAIVCLAAGLFVFFSLVSYYPLDPSWNTAAANGKAVNLTGRVGAFLSDLLLQGLGLAAYAIPALILCLGWKWARGRSLDTAWFKIACGLLLIASTAAALGLFTGWKPVAGRIPAGGLAGSVLADLLLGAMNLTGAVLVTGASWLVAIYLLSTFEMERVVLFLQEIMDRLSGLATRFRAWREARAQAARAKATLKAQQKSAAKAEPAVVEPVPAIDTQLPMVDSSRPQARSVAAAAAAPAQVLGDIPIRTLDQPESARGLETHQAGNQPSDNRAPWEEPADAEPPASIPGAIPASRKRKTSFRIPSTELLQEPAARNAYDSQELKETAALIKSKFEEFNVLGSVTQINPGPVVTTFEFKPEAGIKYSRITTLNEDLCLGLQAESILIERIPGKPTVGIEVPNTKREVISLRQILESGEFLNSPSPLTVALGKDINGRIKVAALDSMPHLLIAGSTGSGKSVMLNSLIMSVLYKSTPEQVRMIMVDPKRLEFGPYEGVPHLLTPVITDAKKATNALRNAVLEMERRLKLLAAQGVRNIDQFNRKMRQLQAQPRSLFEEDTAAEEEELQPLPYVLILIDELADLMMLERANVEESVTRLAQMARAVGMHLVLATQRPSVDVITGLIKANFPSRISFRVATRVDSRTVLDVMGAEHLLGKGDMLFLPPGSSRLVRVHGSYVSEAETARVVEFWKQQAEPDYDKSFLLAPPSEEDDGGNEELDGPEDPLYQEAVRVVCELGKASTSTLQRRLRLGYGRAARILDMMQRDGIIGPPDGSRPRDVLKRPGWLSEVENQLR